MTFSVLLLAAITNITGVVTFAREGLPFYFITEPSGEHWRVAKTEGASARPGDWIVATGA